MIFYHGTTLDAARQIQKQGLIPHRESAYQLVDDNGDYLRDMPGEDKPYIYLQSQEQIAEDYARFRAMYERANYGQLIDTGDASQLAAMEKITRKRNPNAKPALVTFDVPEAMASQFEMDYQNWDGGHVCLCVIPPKYITSVTEVR
jgi:hypothetical protein